MDTKILKGGLDSYDRKLDKRVRKKLIEKRDTPIMHNSSLEDPFDGGSLRNSFKGILGGEKSLKKYIEDKLESKKGKAVGVEFGGNAVDVFKGFSKDFFIKSVGICLEERAETIDNLAILDRFNSSNSTHYVLTGDIFEKNVYETLDSINIKSADLILERMAAGFVTIPQLPIANIRIVQKWYEMLNEGGLMLIQVPGNFEQLLDRWVKFVESEYSNTLSVAYDNDGCGFDAKVLRVHKLAGAPEKFPLFPLED